MSIDYAAALRREDVLTLLLRLKGTLWFTERLLMEEGAAGAAVEYGAMAWQVHRLAAELAREERA